MPYLGTDRELAPHVALVLNSLTIKQRQNLRERRGTALQRASVALQGIVSRGNEAETTANASGDTMLFFQKQPPKTGG